MAHTLAQPPRQMRANQKVMAKTCTTCGRGFQLAEEVWSCGECEGFHHAACLDVSVGCRRAAAPAITTDAPASIPAQVEQVVAPQETPLSRSDDETRKCPVCAETIKKAALKCRYCGHVLDSRVTQTTDIAPPPIHWLLDLLLSVASCFLVSWVMMIWQSRWAKKVDTDSRATLYFVLSLVVYFIGAALNSSPESRPIGSLLVLAAVVLFQCGNFSVKQSIEYHYNDSEFGPFQLGGVATFFFGQLYFQYRFNAIAKHKRMTLSAQLA